MTDIDLLKKLLTIGREAAAAGAAVLAERDTVAPAGQPLDHRRHGITTKSSESDFVTDFDKRAEEQVRAVISTHRPHDVISGEEHGTSSVASPTGYRWSIDPLDGTTNFVRGIVYYGTSVGLQAPDGQWIVGVVVAPALRKEWWAARGLGAFTARNGSAPVPLEGPRGDISSGLLATGFGYDPQRKAQQAQSVAAMNDHFGNIRRLGAAALDICMVAEGAQDAYAEYGIQEHDWAGAAVIADEVGVPVRRPASVNGSEAPDWCIVGRIGIGEEDLQPAPSRV
ncbi:inositol monophosphatase family protein [Nesterenkonia natronophila]|uniref:Inositol monophosphatase n=1 Tax=Nesterenkonia natronophila TaxID=2174932 RepID=A0A3A4F989_9MICC|nr:inositol monophosphatase family protein [Nesterenkonia natronophila]RJN31757.1 inositol monophosphatase [Nesterenkonia natronophila]